MKGLESHPEVERFMKECAKLLDSSFDDAIKSIQDLREVTTDKTATKELAGEVAYGTTPAIFEVARQFIKTVHQAKDIIAKGFKDAN